MAARDRPCCLSMSELIVCVATCVAERQASDIPGDDHSQSLHLVLSFSLPFNAFHCFLEPFSAVRCVHALVVFIAFLIHIRSHCNRSMIDASNAVLFIAGRLYPDKTILYMVK